MEASRDVGDQRRADVRIIVISALPRCPAGAALYMEGIEHELKLVGDNDDYSQLLTQLWLAGEEFLTLEHDVVPTPGTLQALRDCPAAWCQHLSFTGPGKLRQGLGSLRVSKEALSQARDLPSRWLGTHWRYLDGKVVPAMEQRFGPAHFHEPPFAHVRPSGWH